MGTVEKLSSFKDHLYDMLVAMMSRSEAGTQVKEEDVHGNTVHGAYPPAICFG
jgi:hypothetical protein